MKSGKYITIQKESTSDENITLCDIQIFSKARKFIRSSQLLKRKTVVSFSKFRKTGALIWEHLRFHIRMQK